MLEKEFVKTEVSHIAFDGRKATDAAYDLKNYLNRNKNCDRTTELMIEDLISLIDDIKRTCDKIGMNVK